MSDKKYPYRVKPGRAFGPYREYGPGDVLQLTEPEAAGFPDTLALVKDPGEPDEPTDPRAHLETLTVPQLKNLKEWDEVEPPKPSTKDEIIDAILAVREQEAV